MPDLTNELRKQYNDLFASCAVNAERNLEVSGVVNKIIQNKSRYETAGGKLGVPWFFIAVIHNMESSMSFQKHLHNGDPLTARTVQVPKGRPIEGTPPFSWEESASDALKYQNLDKWHDWSLSGMLYKLEEYNGWGYRNHHSEVLSPYLWSFTNYYTKGKYVADGKWSDTAVSGQCGAVALLKALYDKNEIEFSDAPKSETTEPQPVSVRSLSKGSKGEDVKRWQEFLIQHGYNLGDADGMFGTKTYYATVNFQSDNGLKADGVAGPKTLAKAAEFGNKPVEVPEPAVEKKDPPNLREKIEGLTYSDWEKIFSKHMVWSRKNKRTSGTPEWKSANKTLNVIGIRCNDEKDFNYGRYNDYLVLIFNKSTDDFSKIILNVTVDPGIPTTTTKARAHLRQGMWNSYVVRPHNYASRTFPIIGYQKRWALCQDKDEVQVLRTDGNGNLVGSETGTFGINIHDTGGYRDSSIGCTVVQNDQSYVKYFLPCLFDLDTGKYVPANHDDVTYCLVNQQQFLSYLD